MMAPGVLPHSCSLKASACKGCVGGLSLSPFVGFSAFAAGLSEFEASRQSDKRWFHDAGTPMQSLRHCPNEFTRSAPHHSLRQSGKKAQSAYSGTATRKFHPSIRASQLHDSFCLQGPAYNACWGKVLLIDISGFRASALMPRSFQHKAKSARHNLTATH